MATAQVLKVTHLVDDSMGQLQVYLQQDLRRWLSPSDPSTNHNLASDSRREGTAGWFLQGSIFREWKFAGSLLWVHGKRTSILPF